MDLRAEDAAAFDSVPGPGFDTSPFGRRDRAAAGKDHRQRAGAVARSGAEQQLPRHQPRLEERRRRAVRRTAAISITGLSEAQQSDLVTSLALVAERSSATGAPVKKPRIGLFQPWGGSMDEGWTRWVLEQYGFEYVTLRPADFKAPLTGKVDAVILADDARLPIEGAAGGRGGGGRGGGQVRPEYADRLSPADLATFEQFIRGGGTLICFNSASNFAIQQFKLPVRNVVAGLRTDEFFLRGTIVEVTTDPSQQVMAGMPEKAAVFADSSPVFETQDGFKGNGPREVPGHRLTAAVGLPHRREVPARQGGGIGRATRRRACHPPGLPAGVARAAVRHVQGPVQRGAQCRPLTASAYAEHADPGSSGRKVRVACLVLALIAVAPRGAAAYSVLAHQSNIDALWESHVRPALLARYPRTSEAALREARAHAYGESVIQDLGYFPFGSKFFTNLLHYVKTGQFVETMLREAHDVDELAFAIGALCHYAADAEGHAMAVNRAVPLMYPKLRARFGDSVAYDQAPKQHILVEFAFDVLLVAHGGYKLQAYHDFIGFKVSKPLLERAFLKPPTGSR